jgi:hypothetical protein
MPELQWKTEIRGDAEFTSAYYNGIEIIILRPTISGMTYYIAHMELAITFRDPYFHYLGNLDKAKLEIQEKFNTFYNKYKPLFEGEKT